MTDNFEIHIREATQTDSPTIKQMVREERLDPTSLKWQHFLVAVHADQIIGIGQIKQYPGCEELGSLVTNAAYRGRGVAGKLIAALEARAGRPLYLLCAAKMEPFYHRFDYETMTWWQAPAFLKLKLAPTILLIPFGIRVRVMCKNA